MVWAAAYVRAESAATPDVACEHADRIVADLRERDTGSRLNPPRALLEAVYQAERAALDRAPDATIRDRFIVINRLIRGEKP
jgi:hypothetical protein